MIKEQSYNYSMENITLEQFYKNKSNGKYSDYMDHGMAYDRGSADSWYSRPIDPHYWTDGSYGCLLYTSPSPRDRQKSRMPSSA